MMMAGLLGAGLGMMGQMAQYQQQKAQTDQYNAEAMVNARDSSLAANAKYSDINRKYIYDSRSLQQQGYEANAKGLQAMGATKASAGSAGFDPGSHSVTSILADEDNQLFRAMDNVKTKADDLRGGVLADQASTFAEAQGRTNSMPLKMGPDPAGLMINMASAGLGAAKGFIQ